MRWLGLTVTGIALLMPMYALSEPYVRYRPGYSTTYASTEETIEKLEILLEELEQGEHDAVIKTAEKSYSVVRKTEHQCANYHKALSRIKSSSVEGKKRKSLPESIHPTHHRVITRRTRLNKKNVTKKA